MKYSLYLVIILLLIGFVERKIWQKEIIGGGDAWGYYVYLPAIFIHDDIKSLETSYKTRIQYKASGWIADKEIVTEAYQAGQNKVIKYTIGIALLEFPYFVIAHITAGLSGYPQDGCSLPYMFIVNLGLLIYVFLGLYYLEKWLNLYYDKSTTGGLLLLLGLGTNLYFFALTAMAHATLFSLYAILLYNTELFFRQKEHKHLIGIGLSIGFIILIRPVELLCVLIPLLYSLGLENGTHYTANGLIQRLLFIKKEYKRILLTALIPIGIGSVQLFYWQHVSGSWLFYSYGGESFDFKNPHIYEGLFSFQNGWFVYTPLMATLVLGLFFYKNKLLRANYLLIGVFFSTHIYITYSWWCWQYINGLGSRPMVDIYAVAMIPLSAVWVYLYNKIKLLGLTLGLFFISLNLFQTYQQWQGIIWAEAGSKQFYLQTFFKPYLEYNDLIAMDIDYHQPKKEELNNIKLLAELEVKDKKIAPAQFSENLHLDTNQNQLIKAKTWLKISCKAQKNYTGADIYRMSALVIEVREEGKEKPRVWKGIRVDNKIACGDEISLWGGKKDLWGWVYFYYQLDTDLSDKMRLKTYLWNNSPYAVQLDSLKVEMVN